jgi:hypothetical protein
MAQLNYGNVQPPLIYGNVLKPSLANNELKIIVGEKTPSPKYENDT